MFNVVLFGTFSKNDIIIELVVLYIMLFRSQSRVSESDMVRTRFPHGSFENTRVFVLMQSAVWIFDALFANGHSVEHRNNGVHLYYKTNNTNKTNNRNHGLFGSSRHGTTPHCRHGNQTISSKPKTNNG